MLADNHNSALDGAYDLGAIMSFLPRDPNHILMVLDGYSGRSLFKVDLESGLGEQIEPPSESVVGWWLDVDGTGGALDRFGGTLRFYRKDAEGKWQKFSQHAHARDEGAARLRSRGPVGSARKILRAGAAAGPGSRRALSI